MFCTKCGMDLGQGATSCANCGAPPAMLPPSPTFANRANWDNTLKPPTYLIFAILSTVLCCWPLGIVAIVYAAQVDSKFHQGDLETAKRYSSNALIWSWISFGAVAILGLGYIILVAIAVVLEA